MDALKQQLLKVQQQLAGLSASQKMLTASLMVIMVMTLFYWSRFASVSDMVPVIDKPLSASELADVKAAVTAEGIQSEERDGRILVPSAKQAQVTAAMSKLALNGKLPAAYTQGDAAADKPSLFESSVDRAQRQREAASRKLAEIIRGWPGVTNAVVMLSGEKRGGTLNPINPTASVDISFDGDAKSRKKIADAARTIVSHAQVGLSPADVGITVNALAVKNDDGDAYGGEGVFGKRKEAEEYFAGNVRTQLGIEKLLVSVNAKMDNSSTTSTEHLLDPKNKVEALKNQKTSTEENTRAATGGQPGMTSNTGIMDDAQAAPGNSSSVEKTETQNEVAIGYKNVSTMTPAGAAQPQTASIGVPESYYRKVWKYYNPKASGEPGIADLKPLIDQQEARIRNSVKTTLAINDDKAVTVATYFDIDTLAGDTVTASLAPLPSSSTGFGAKEIALGALAVISLFMVSMMVKKSAPQPILVAAPMAAEPAADIAPGLLSVRDLAGEVSEADLTMTGQELSEEAIEARQVIEQVGSMVKQNPEQAATLIKRWLNQD